MEFGSFARLLALCGAALSLTAACAGTPDGSDGVSNTTEALGRPTWGRFPKRPPSAPTATATATTTTPLASTSAPPTSGPPPGSTPPQSADAVIAAARTPDGQAIPQPAGPNGACPAVVVLLGFWACPTEGQTCNYASNGTHDCVCDRVDGEGQTPAWVCN